MNHDTAFGVFLSHNSVDKPAVEELARRLLACTPPIRCWLDKDDLRAQGTWMSQIEDVIASCEAAVLFYGPSGLGKFQERERQLLVAREAEQPDTFRLIPILLPRAKPSDVTGFAKLHNWVDFTAGLDSPAAFERLVAFLRGEAPRSTMADDEIAPDIEPYRGLERFDGEHAGFFFGRDREIRELCNRMRAWPFVAVIGGSGSGKSSLVRAGLRTALASEEFPRLEEAIRITVLPGANPLRALADQVAAVVPKPDGQPPEALADAFEARFRERPDGLLTLLTSRFPEDSTSVLIAIDQFEELFTHCRDMPDTPGRCRGQTEQFVRLLDVVAGSGVDRLRVVVTVRADFLDRCLQVASLVALIQDHQFLLGELSPESLREVIVRPAQQAGAYFEKGLAARILQDVEGEHGSLPLLQQALKELWARRRGRWLTNEGYEETGGVAGALRKRADETMKGLDPAQREIARNIFLRLTTPGEGVGDSRRRVRLDALYPARADRATVDAVVDRLRAKESRLIVTNDDGTAEVTHEALIRTWAQLRAWLDDAREDLRLHHRLTDAAHEWFETSPDDPSLRDPAYLWDGTRLSLAEAFHAEHPRALNAQERAFLDASVVARSRRAADKLANARRLAAGLLSVTIVTSLLAGWGFYEMSVARSQTSAAKQATKEAERQTKIAKEEKQKTEEQAKIARRNEGIANAQKSEAERQASIATSRQLAALSVSERARRLDLSLILAVEALRTWDTLEARACLFRALWDRPRLLSSLPIVDGHAWDVAFSPDGKTLAAAVGSGTGDRGGVKLWDAATGRRLGDGPLPVKEGSVRDIAFSPDGKTIALAYVNVPGGPPGGGGVVLWDAVSRRRVGGGPLLVEQGEGSVDDVAFSPDRRTIAAAVSHGVILWDLATRRRLADRPLPVSEGYVMSVAFSPDGKTLAAGIIGSAVGVVLWDAGSRHRLVDDPLPLWGFVQAVAFSPDGKTIAAGYAGKEGSSGGIALWNATSRQRLTDRPLTVSEGDVFNVAFSPDGKTIVADILGRGSRVVLWDTATGRRLADEPLPIKDGVIRGVAFSPDSRTVAVGVDASGATDRIGGVILWDAAGQQRPADWLLPIEVEWWFIHDVTFSPDGRTIGAGVSGLYSDGGIMLWDAASRRRLVDKPLAMDSMSWRKVWGVAFSPDSKVLAAGVASGAAGGGGGIGLWDASSRRQLIDKPLPVNEGEVCDVAFSPDGKALAAAVRRFDPPARGGFDIDRGVGIVLWDAATRRRLTDRPLLVDEGQVLSTAFSPDGKFIAAGLGDVVGSNGGLVLWDAATRRRLTDRPLPFGGGWAQGMAFSPDGQVIAAGGFRGVGLWDAASRRRLTEVPLPVEEGEVQGMAFSPDGNTIAVGGIGGVVLWDASLRRRLTEVPLPVGEGKVQGVTFSPDGKALAAGIPSRGVALWDVDIQSLQRRAGRIANRNLTRIEWRRYLPDEPYRPTFPDLPIPPEAPAQEGKESR